MASSMHREIAIMKSLDHPHVVNVRACPEPRNAAALSRFCYWRCCKITTVRMSFLGFGSLPPFFLCVYFILVFILVFMLSSVKAYQ